jgi:hypothetical protein
MIHPVPTQSVCSTFDQTFTWPSPAANKVLAGANHLDSPWSAGIIPVKSGCKIIRLQYFEINTVIDNNGPGPFAFDIYAQFVTPPPLSYAISLLPPVYASHSAILQRVDADAVPQGWTAQVTFSVTFSTSSFHLGPGVALADASGINYTDNTLTTTVQDSFAASFGFKGTTSYGYITIGPMSSIRVQGTSEIQGASTSTTTSSSISEFDTAAIVLTLSALITVLALTQTKGTTRKKDYV